MFLSDKAIRASMKAGDISIDPFDAKHLGSNSYDVHLGKTLACYKDTVLDAKKDNQIDYFDIEDDGFILKPNKLYLGVIKEYTESYKHLPFFDGKSSVGRLGIFVHITAGRGDVGFENHWTLEIVTVMPVRIYSGMPIGQISYAETTEVEVPYNKKGTAKYNGRNPLPMRSLMFMNFIER